MDIKTELVKDKNGDYCAKCEITLRCKCGDSSHTVDTVGTGMKKFRSIASVATGALGGWLIGEDEDVCPECQKPQMGGQNND